MSAMAQDAPAADGELHDQFAYNFRGRPLPTGMVPFGPQAEKFIKLEAEGLRITLPKGRESAEPVGLSMALRVGGDFEITLAFEILQAQQPTPAQKSYGVGMLMSVNMGAGRIGWLERAQGAQVVTWDRVATVGGQSQFQSGAAPCTGKVGRLRLKRTKTTLHYLWAPGLVGDNFEEVHRWEFTTDEITVLRLVTASKLDGGEAAALDVRLLELTGRSTAPARPGRRGLLVAAAIFGLVILLVVVGTLVERYRRRRAQAPAPVADAPAKPEAATPPVAFACSGCGKRLNARAELAGKTIKCPQCSKPVIVPAITA